jgi:hypothetical protein
MRSALQSFEAVAGNDSRLFIGMIGIGWRSRRHREKMF